MSATELRKQISMFLPISDWRRLRLEAAQQGIPITELCRRWMEPEVERLRQRSVPDAMPMGHSGS
ncbi:MAG: hypothetical protein R3C01_01945 [Planctomycetaceae bacterium]